MFLQANTNEGASIQFTFFMTLFMQKPGGCHVIVGIKILQEVDQLRGLHLSTWEYRHSVDICIFSRPCLAALKLLWLLRNRNLWFQGAFLNLADGELPIWHDRISLKLQKINCQGPLQVSCHSLLLSKLKEKPEIWNSLYLYASN